MLESFSPGRRSRTVLLLGAVAVLAVAAGVVGIDDNAIGISLVMFSAASLVLAFAHPWPSAQFRRLIYASVLGFVALMVLGIGLQALVGLAGLPGPIDRVLEVVETACFLGAAFLCIPGLLVGIIGTVIKRRRERDQRLVT